MDPLEMIVSRCRENVFVNRELRVINVIYVQMEHKLSLMDVKDVSKCLEKAQTYLRTVRSSTIIGQYFVSNSLQYGSQLGFVFKDVVMKPASLAKFANKKHPSKDLPSFDALVMGYATSTAILFPLFVATTEKRTSLNATC